ncbi:unnamed protein product [Lota lota]
MSGGGALQQRTTYLISLTLVKVEAVAEDGEDTRKAAQEREDESEAEARHGTRVGGVGSEETRVRGGAAESEASARTACGAGVMQGQPDSRGGEKTPSALEAKKCISPSLTGMSPMETTEPVRTPTRSSFPIRPVGQRPVSLLKSHSSVTTRGRDSRDGRERSPTSAQSLDRKDSRMPTRSPGPCRASWAEASRTEGWREAEADGRARVGMPLEVGGGVAPAMRDMPRKERLKTGSASLPAPASQPPKPRKGKSRTLDNSDLNILSEDLALTREIQQSQRGSAKDRKMLKFISGIFTKSSSGSSATGPPVYLQRDSSEEEGRGSIGMHTNKHLSFPPVWSPVNIANSQEWTLNRSIPELHLCCKYHVGCGGLLHENLVLAQTPFGPAARYKKEPWWTATPATCVNDPRGNPPSRCKCWVDAVLLVFSLENEGSFLELYQLYSQLHTHRADLPIIVVGTQDKISSTNPRVIDDQRARQLCIDVRHSLFYETCATYGFNVERVFSEAVQKIVAQKKQAALLACKSLPNSPSHSGGSTPGSASFPGQGGEPCSLPSTPVVSHRELRLGVGEGTGGSVNSRSLKNIPHRRPSLFKNRDSDKKGTDSKGDLGSGRAISIKQSILWKRSSSSLNKEWKKKYVTLSNNGMLSYHSSSSDYMQNVHGKDIDLLRVTVKVPGKRPPRAVAPAGPCVGPPLAPAGGPTAGVNGVPKGGPSSEAPAGTVSPQLCPSTLTVADDRAGVLSPLGGDKGLQRCASSLSTKAQMNPFTAKEASQSSPLSDRKKNRRKKSMNQKGDAVVGQAEAKRKMWKLKSFGSLRNINKTEEENADFIVVSFTGQTWHFEAQSLEDRDSWVAAIESQILASLQSCESGRNKARRSSRSEAVALQAIRNTKGNGLCVDCEAPNPTWASLNLGSLICIECSGIHRNLGTHLSRVRSLDLDDWPGELTQVLAAIGNHTANGIWESCTQGRTKPTSSSTREERESWIRAKYEQRLFVAPLGPPPVGGHDVGGGVAVWLHSAVTERDLPRLLLLLAHSTKEQINSPPVGPPPSPACTALHAACQLGDVVMTQLLIWYGSDVEARDTQGRTALVFARKTSSKGCVDILLQHGCPNDATPTATPVLSRRSSSASLGRTNSRKRPS